MVDLDCIAMLLQQGKGKAHSSPGLLVLCTPKTPALPSPADGITAVSLSFVPNAKLVNKFSFFMRGRKTRNVNATVDEV